MTAAPRVSPLCVETSLRLAHHKNEAVLRKAHQVALSSDSTRFEVAETTHFRPKGYGKGNLTEDSCFTEEETKAERGRGQCW